MRGLESLRASHPWPEKQPDFPDTPWGWGIGGEALLRSLLPPDARCILEIGSLLGGSAAFFAEARPQALLLCLDPWEDVRDRPLLEHAPELAPYLNDREDGLYQTFLASTWTYRDRLVPIRGYSPGGLLEIYEAGLVPDFIYIDASHEYEDVLVDLNASRLLFPDAVITGDDWSWSSVNAAVRFFAERNGLGIDTDDNTWALTASGTLREGAPPEIPASRRRGLLKRGARALRRVLRGA